MKKPKKHPASRETRAWFHRSMEGLTARGMRGAMQSLALSVARDLDREARRRLKTDIHNGDLLVDTRARVADLQANVAALEHPIATPGCSDNDAALVRAMCRTYGNHTGDREASMLAVLKMLRGRGLLR